MKKRQLFLVLSLFLYLFLLVNLKFTAWPEMVSYPYLFNHGFKLYQDFIYPYPPLLTWLLALIYKIFGYKLLVLKIFTWTLLVINDLLIFLILKKLAKNFKTAALGVWVYVALQPFLEGNMLWFDIVIVTPLLAGLFFLIERKYFWAGLFLGIACLIKQTGGIFLFLGSLGYVIGEKKIRGIGVFWLGPFVLGYFLFVYLLLQGLFWEFVEWTLWHPLVDWGKVPGYVNMVIAGRDLLILGVLLLSVIFLEIKKEEDKYLLLFLLGGLISVYPRFSWFHMQSAIAFLAIIYALVAVRKRYQLFTVIGLVLLLLFINHSYVLKREWSKEARFWAKEDLNKAQKIKSLTSSDEKIFLLGEHSGLYVFADRLPAGRWSDNFAWYLELEHVQGNIIWQWFQDPPSFVFWRVPGVGESELGWYQPQEITSWIRKNYTKGEEVWKGTWLWKRN